jgi:predicted double-glycine peptidase
MEIVASFLILIYFLSSMLPLRDSSEYQLLLYDEVPSIELALKYNVKPLSEFKDQNIVKQEYDYSCGSAALATVLNYYLGEEFTEHQVIQGLMTYGDEKLIEQRRAFSLLDMKRFVGVLGYKGAGYKAEIADLEELESPAIIPIEFYGYKHFVVLKGIYQDHIFFADPFMGNISFPMSQFEKMWLDNVVFLVSEGEINIDALLLKEEDLWLVAYEMSRPAVSQDIPPSFIEDERRFKESGGKYQYKTVNVK